MTEQLLMAAARTAGLAFTVGLMATCIGRYAGGGPARRLGSWRARVAVFYQVWGVTFMGIVLFGALGAALQFSDGAQAGFARFILPLVASTYFCRQHLRAHQNRA